MSANLCIILNWINRTWFAPPPSVRIEIRLWVKVTSINQETSHSLPPSSDKHCQNFWIPVGIRLNFEIR